MYRRYIVTLGIVWTALAGPIPAGDLDGALSRIDRAGASFKGMSAHMIRVTHTAAINEDNTDSGTMLLKRTHPRDMRMLVDFTQPDPKTVAFQGHKVDIYFPKMETVQEYDVGKSRELLDEFFLVGFGTSRGDLEASYSLRLVGSDTVNGQKADRLELIPKSKEVLAHLPRLEIWVGENGYPIQQEFHQPGGDYMLFTYSDMKINPDLADSALKLHLPKSVKWEYPQK